MESQYSLKKVQIERRSSSSPNSNVPKKSFDSEGWVNVSLDGSTKDDSSSAVSTISNSIDKNVSSEKVISEVGSDFNVEKEAKQLLDRQSISEEEYAIILKNHFSALNKTNQSSTNYKHGAAIEEKANRLLREGSITEEEYMVILRNHTSAMNRTTIPLSPPQQASNSSNSPSTTSPPQATPRNHPPSRRRHMAEKQAISSLSKAEKERQKKSKKRHEQIAVNMEVWKSRILPRWEEYKASSEVAKLVQQGIPTSLRSKVWMLLVNDKLNITPEIYRDHLEEALKMYDSNGRLSVHRDSREEDGTEDRDDVNDNDLTCVSNRESGDEKVAVSNTSNSISTIDDVEKSAKLALLVDSMTLIQRDIPRTFPTLSFFHDDGPLASALDHVLKAYACYEPKIGYVQGMSYVAALLLLYLDEYETFVCFSNILAIRTNRDFYLLEQKTISGYVCTFNHFFKQFLPLLCEHFENEGISSEIFLLDWHLTIFTKALPLEIAARIWDCYLHCGEVYILRASLGLLRLFARRLSSLTMEKILPFLSHVPEEELTAEKLISSIENIKISPEKYGTVRLQFDENMEHNALNMGALTVDSGSIGFSFRKSLAGMFY